MTWRRALALAAGLAGAAASPARLTAQVVLPAPPARYLLTTDVDDARALWVNPAGLARRLEASIGADLSADRFANGTVQLSQYGATIASRGLAVSWIHDRYPGGGAVNAYAVGAGLGDEQFSGGVTRRWYRGLVSFSAWDIALRGMPASGVQFSLVGRGLGSPLPDSTYRPTVVPGASVALLDGAVHVGAEWEVAAHRWRSQEIRAGGTAALGGAFALTLRADLAPDLKRRRIVVALTWNPSRARVSGFAGLSGGLNEVDELGASGALVALSPPTRR
ncbi:MAG: hypothetical protein ABSG61_03420 [Gemmatimonadales bacterium]